LEPFSFNSSVKFRHAAFERIEPPFQGGEPVIYGLGIIHGCAVAQTAEQSGALPMVRFEAGIRSRKTPRQHL
jgi:hypothetical protein